MPFMEKRLLEVVRFFDGRDVMGFAPWKRTATLSLSVDGVDHGFSAETPQLRCAGGLFALLAHTSHRGLRIRSRSMQVTESDFAGESPAKTFDTRTPWVIHLCGNTGMTWPTLWMQELLAPEFSGPDF